MYNKKSGSRPRQAKHNWWHQQTYYLKHCWLQRWYVLCWLSNQQLLLSWKSTCLLSQILPFLPLYSQRLQKHKCLEAIQHAISSGSYRCREVGISDLRHFLYKSKSTAQFTSPELEAPYDDPKERERLVTLDVIQISGITLGVNLGFLIAFIWGVLLYKLIVSPMVTVSAAWLGSCGFESWPGYAEDFKDGTYCLLFKCFALKEWSRGWNTRTSGLTHCSFHWFQQACGLEVLETEIGAAHCAIQCRKDFTTTCFCTLLLLCISCFCAM